MFNEKPGGATAPAVQTRTAWTDLPKDVHRHVADILGGPVTRAISQIEGFSPGSADRVETAAGRRAFVKAVERERNPGTFDLHHREIRVMAALPSEVSAPSLLGTYSQGDWVALILEDVEGRHPGGALDGSDVIPVLDALATFPKVDQANLVGLPKVSDEIVDDANGWSDLLENGVVGELPVWIQESFGRLHTVAGEAFAAAAGDFLVHLDCRADNVLIDPAGTAWLIDWPWASVGARWIDGVTYLLDARLRGEAVDAEALVQQHPLFDAVPGRSIDAVLAALTGGFFNKARRPAPPNMPTVRDFQKNEALAGADWLRERWS